MNVKHLLTKEEYQQLLPIAKKLIKKNYKEYIIFKRITVLAKYMCGHHGFVEFDTAMTHIINTIRNYETVYKIYHVDIRAKNRETLFAMNANIILNGTQTEFETELNKLIKYGPTRL